MLLLPQEELIAQSPEGGCVVLLRTRYLEGGAVPELPLDPQFELVIEEVTATGADSAADSVFAMAIHDWTRERRRAFAVYLADAFKGAQVGYLEEIESWMRRLALYDWPMEPLASVLFDLASSPDIRLAVAARLRDVHGGIVADAAVTSACQVRLWASGLDRVVPEDAGKGWETAGYHLLTDAARTLYGICVELARNNWSQRSGLLAQYSDPDAMLEGSTSALLHVRH